MSRIYSILRKTKKEFLMSLQMNYKKLIEILPSSSAREKRRENLLYAFPSVAAVTAAAPRLKNWKITAFRPRRDVDQTDPLQKIEFQGKVVDARNVQFTLLDNGQIAGIYLFIPGFKDGDKDLQQIAYLLLDSLLGEYDVETKLGLIEIFSPEAKTQWERYPLSALPKAFDELTAKLKGRPDFQN